MRRTPGSSGTGFRPPSTRECASRGSPAIPSSYFSLLGERLDRDDDFASGVPRLEIADSVCRLAERVGAVDDRPDLSGFDQVFENHQVLLAVLRQEKRDLLGAQA